MSDARQQLAGDLFDAALREIARRIKDGTATAAELTVALNAARYLDIKQLPKPNNGAGALLDALPFTAEGIEH